ncbi:MAG TPA: T9SS type A sorting domain-containing protein [Rubricoccaceae bacterium]|nr:T9SS type A sorting domain-containing protein [Rubricoccaceae bacterium]
MRPLVLATLVLAASLVHAQAPPLDLAASISEGATHGIGVDGGLAVFSNGAFLEAVDVSDPDHPVRLGRLDWGSLHGPIHVHGDLAFVSGLPYGGTGLHVVDVSNPAAMRETDAFPGWRVMHVVAQGDYAYVGTETSAQLIVLDVSDPSNVVPVAYRSVSGQVVGLHVEGSLLYLMAANRLYVFDVTDPTQPLQRASVPFPYSNGAQGLGYADGVVYVAGHRFIHPESVTIVLAYDVTTPSSPVMIGELHLDEYFPHSLVNVHIEGERLMAQSGDYMAVVDVSDPTAMEALAERRDHYGYDSEIVGGRFLLGALDGGIEVFDLTDPTAPVLRARVPNGGYYGAIYTVFSSYSSAAAFADGWLRLLSREALRTFAFDDQNRPVLLGRAPVRWNSLAVRGGIAYASSNRAVLTADITDPASPVVLGTCTPCLGENLALAESTLVDFRSGAYPQLTTVDVSDITNPRLADTFGPAYFPGHLTFASGGLALAGAGPISHVLDVSDPYDIRETDRVTWRFGSAVYDAEFRGAYAFLARWDSLMVLDLSDPSDVRVVGALDVDGGVRHLAWMGDHLYGAGGSTLYGFDVRDPAAPALTFTLPLRAPPVLLAADSLRLVAVYETLGYDVFDLAGPVATEPLPGETHALVVAPNPTRGATTLSLSIPYASAVRVGVYDGLGREVAALLSGERAAGRHEVAFDASALSPGVYFVRAEAGGAALTRALTVLR